MDNMIGYPDNIRLSDHGTFLVGITTPRFKKAMPPFLDMIAPYPAVKRFLAKVSVFYSQWQGCTDISDRNMDTLLSVSSTSDIIVMVSGEVEGLVLKKRAAHTF